jgi:RNA polymerase sigma factor (sigma-70 family)
MQRATTAAATAIPLGDLIGRATAARDARAEQQHAFGEIVRRFQDMAFGCAYAVLGDFGLAEDVAQESFLTAWRHLDQLRTADAFPGWFQRIVVTQCYRLTRSRRLTEVPLDSARDVPSELGAAGDPYTFAARAETRARVLAAIQALPENERIAITLYYINDHPVADIAAFLDVPVTTIKKRLYSARQRLKESIMDLVPGALQERRPSNDTAFVNTVALYNAALESFLARVQRDRNIIAVVLFGSLSYDEVWKRSDIDLMLVARTDKERERGFCLIENGVNIHATLYPRNRFKAALEGSLQGSFFHSAFARSTLLYTTDETIRGYYENLDRVGDRDRDFQVLRAAHNLLYVMAKAEKWLTVKKDVEYTFLWILYAVESLARIETLLQGEVTTREVIQQALRCNPAFFRSVYTDLIHGPKDLPILEAAVRRIDAYIDARLPALFRPVLDYLREADVLRTTSEINAYLHKQAQIGDLSAVYEWLADKGILQKVPSPVRLTDRSPVAVVDEAAYHYDPAGAAAVIGRGK